MSYNGVTHTKFGRYQVAEPMRMETLHFYQGEMLHGVDHEPPIPVLDQEDLLAQGIHTSQLVPGAADVDALGSCTCNAGTVSLAERMARKYGLESLSNPGLGLSTTDSVVNEEFAIRLYHAVTFQTGEPAQEWPPTDCGSTGLYVCTELQARLLTAGHKSAHDIHSMVSLLQDGTVIMGSPWFNAWMEPDEHGFVDGNGTVDDLNRAIESGVAGGHETCITAAERLTFLGADHRLDPEKCVVRVRNSWSPHWGDNGSYRIHLSTLQRLGSYIDFKQIVV